ncbi:MAG: 3-phosphoserine/phosphohydroxythreonine transaminase [Polyangiales bacterium]
MSSPIASPKLRRVHNFNAGPAGLPLPALELARDELLDFAGSGMSILEHSHRGKEYDAVHHEVMDSLRRLLHVPTTHDVLLLQGGASQHFAQVPMNFLRAGRRADYVVTGGWSEKALAEAQIVGDARASVTTAMTSEEGQTVYRRIPKQPELAVADDAAYAHYTTNNTLFGTEFSYTPEAPRGVPLIADASSDFLSKPIDVAKHALIYAGAQKNIGPSGVVVVIADKAFMAAGRTDIPKIFRYSTHAREASLYHTPPTFAVYLARNVLRWVDAIGGLDAIVARNERKASTLYGALDAMSGFYRAPVERESRSKMNVVFRLPTAALEESFVVEAKKRDLVGLKGHRSTGGIRASIYNAVSIEDVEALVTFMREFAQKLG